MKIDFDAFLTWHKNDYNYINIGVKIVTIDEILELPEVKELIDKCNALGEEIKELKEKCRKLKED